MAISNVYPGVLWASSGGQVDRSLTIARRGAPGWALAEVQLAWTSPNAMALAWISGRRYMHSSDQIFNEISPEPGGSYIIVWTANCLSITYTLRVSGGYAAAIAKLSPWE